MKLEIIPVKRIVRFEYAYGKYFYMKCIVDFYYFIDGNGPLDIFGQSKELCPEDSWKNKLRWFLDGCFDVTK